MSDKIDIQITCKDARMMGVEDNLVISIDNASVENILANFKIPTLQNYLRKQGSKVPQPDTTK